MKCKNNVWKTWARALGGKSGNSDKEADAVARVRTSIIIFEVIVGGFIIANAIRHW